MAEMKPSRTRRLLRLALLSFLAVTLIAVACNAWLLTSARSRISGHSADIARRDVALVLGTSPRVGGGANPFFEGRMDAAAALWHEGKARHFLLSGDNSHRGYDEPTAMRAAMLSRGVPSEAITLDYAGFRTLDSLVRAREVFGQSRLIIV